LSKSVHDTGLLVYIGTSICKKWSTQSSTKFAGKHCTYRNHSFNVMGIFVHNSVRAGYCVGLFKNLVSKAFL